MNLCTHSSTVLPRASFPLRLQLWNPTPDTGVIRTKSVALRLGGARQEKWTPGQSKESQSQQLGMEYRKKKKIIIL